MRYKGGLVAIIWVLWLVSANVLADKIPGITRPYREVLLGPLAPGNIAKINTKEGDKVKKGTVLLELNCTVQELAAQIAKLSIELMEVNMKIAELKKQKAEVEYKRIIKLSQKDAASGKELRDAETLAKSAQLEYIKAKYMYQNAISAYKLALARLNEHKVIAPFSGYIKKIHKQLGESVDKREGVITLVQLNPLKVYFDCPIEYAGKIHPGDKFEVLPSVNNWKPQIGKVIFVSPSADPASQTFKVKLEIPNNSASWFAGIKVFVDFDKKIK